MKVRKHFEEVPPEEDDSVIGTMRINPDAYRAVRNKDDIMRTRVAVAGLLYMLRHETSIRNLALTSIVVFGLSIWLQIDLLHGVIIFVTLGLVWTTESINSALEAVVDLVTQEIHPMAKVAKDVAASATLVATITATVSTLLLLGPPLIDRILYLIEGM